MLLLLAAGGVWGATFPVVKGALADASVLTFLALRFGLAAVVMLLAGRSGVHVRSGWPAVPCGVALFAGYTLQTAGLLTTTPARSAFITAISVVLVPFLEPLLGLPRPTWRVWAGAAAALIGLAVLLRPEGGAVTVGDLLTAGCAISFAFHVVFLQWAVRRVPAAETNLVQVLTTAALALPAAGLHGFRLVLTGRLVVAVLICAVLATVFAFRAMSESQRVLSAGTTAVVLAFEPVAASVTSVALGQDTISVALIVGGPLVVAGVILASAQPKAA